MRKFDFTECDIYAARIAALRPLPKETLKSLREYYRIGLTYTSNAIDEGVNEGKGEGVNEGVKTLFKAVVDFPGRRANELAVLIGKSVQSVERYVKTLKDAGKIEFRGAPKNGGYYALEKGGE